MRNIEVIKQFLKGYPAKSSSGNLRSTGEKLFSYNTCIAEWVNDYLFVNLTKYSSSTSRIQNMLFKELRFGHKVKQVENVPINTQKLWVSRKM